VTNLLEDSDSLDEDLRAMFGSVGRIERFYLARDKQTNKPKGFAFVTFSNRQDAERAIERFNGAKMEHLILKVEWTKQN
jgi:translation initiation factor 3 subunit G